MIANKFQKYFDSDYMKTYFDFIEMNEFLDNEIKPYMELDLLSEYYLDLFD